MSSDNAVADEFVCKNAGDCSYVSATPACGTLAYTGREWETVANFTSSWGPLGEHARLLAHFAGALCFTPVALCCRAEDQGLDRVLASGDSGLRVGHDGVH